MRPAPEDLPFRQRVLLVKEVEVHLHQGPTWLCARAPLDVHAALVRPPGAPLRILADFESTEPLSALDAPALAVGFAGAGAAMISVPCDRRFLHGSWELFAAVRESLDRKRMAVPLLAKDFVIDARQVAWARDAGADAVLLSVGLVPSAKLRELVVAAQCSEIEPVVEVADETELQTALACGARVIGVNATGLEAHEPDPLRVVRVLTATPPGVVVVSMAGASTAEDVKEAAGSGVHAIRVGEALLRQDDPGAFLRELVANAR
jgi:indole-3-glycerol phosphate synthase